MYWLNRLLISSIVIYFSLLDLNIVQSIKVCNSLSDYRIFDSTSEGNCYDDPVTDMNISEIIRSWPGFTAEEHYVTTRDGYKILVERSYSNITRKTPIILAHGVAMNALGWVNRGNVSLARLLGDLGYDVWMLNYRGTTYSRGHVSLTSNNQEYWKFNFNDWGVQDVRSTAQMVFRKILRKSIYIGFSSGSNAFFIYSSTFPYEARRYFRGMVALAPIARRNNSKSVSRYVNHVWPIFKNVVNSVWNGEILPGYSVYLKPLVRSSTGIYIIQSVLNMIYGDDSAQLDALRFPQFMTQTIDSIGVDIYSHIVQISESGVYQNYDYGRRINLRKYGSASPPKYEVDKIQVPMSFFVGANDFLATPENARMLYSEIKPSVRCGYHVIPYEKWNHIDFVLAKDLSTLFYEDLFNVINGLDAGQCVMA